MKTVEHIASFLHAQEVGCVFEVIGGMIAHLVDAIHRDGRVKLVSVHHEQSAAFAADAYGRMTGRPGVAMATSGPGAINLLTGVGGAYFDSSPSLFMTGQVNRAELKGERNIRQLGFQEADVVSMSKAVTKGAWRIESPAQIEPMFEQACRLAISGRPGPVLLDIPMDVQNSQITPGKLFRIDPDLTPIASLGSDVAAMLDRLAQAKRPLIIAGGGVNSARALHEFRAFVAAAKIPVVHSLMGVDVLPHEHLYRVGMLGSYGNRWSNLAIGEADFLLVIGSRLDIRQTGNDTKSFKANRVVYHVDCEPGEVNNRVTGCTAIISHLVPFLREATEQAISRHIPTPDSWLSQIAELRAKWPDTAELTGVKGINPNQFMRDLSLASSQSSAFIADVGQHQMWAAQSLWLKDHQRFLTSGGMGAMGFSLPAALGVCMAQSDSRPVVIAGDGGFQLNIQELQTIARNKFPVKMVIINNQCHGMVRQFQESYFNARYQSTLQGYSAPDFARVSTAYGIESKTITDPADVAGGLEAMWADPDQPYLLQVMIDTFANAYPKIAFGRAMVEMEPQSKPIEMEGT